MTLLFIVVILVVIVLFVWYVNTSPQITSSDSGIDPGLKEDLTTPKSSFTKKYLSDPPLHIIPYSLKRGNKYIIRCNSKPAARDIAYFQTIFYERGQHIEFSNDNPFVVVWMRDLEENSKVSITWEGGEEIRGNLSNYLTESDSMRWLKPTHDIINITVAGKPPIEIVFKKK